jgi:hypothetical protein
MYGDEETGTPPDIQNLMLKTQQRCAILFMNF